MAESNNMSFKIVALILFKSRPVRVKELKNKCLKERAGALS